MGEVAKYKSGFYDPDQKYSMFRRNYPYSLGDRIRYCADIDWIEWRDGKPVAAVETTRLKDRTWEECLRMFQTRNKGFQPELVKTIADRSHIRSFVVLIDDPRWRNRKEDFSVAYTNTQFHVFELINYTQVAFMATCKNGHDYYRRFLVNFMDSLREDIRKRTGS